MRLAVASLVTLLGVLALVGGASAWQPNASDPLYRQCSEPRSGPDMSLRNYVQAQPLVLHLHKELTQQTDDDLFGGRLDAFRQLYAQYAQQTGCLQWENVHSQLFSRDEIKALLHRCTCRSVRGALVEAVRSVYACDVAVARSGSLHDVYLDRGRRVHTLMRYHVALLTNASVVHDYDALVSKCYTRFFYGVGAITAVAEHREQPTASAARLLRTAATLTAISGAALFLLRRLSTQRSSEAPQQATTAAPGAAAGLAQPD